MLPGGHFVENQAKRKNVGASVEGFAAGLLGRHVGERAHSDAGFGELLGSLRGIVGSRVGVKFGEAEVEDFGMIAFGDEDVGGFDIAMDDALGVSGVESVGNFDGEREKIESFDGLAADAVFQSVAIEKFHGDEGIAVLVVDFVDSADIGVVECGGGFGFAFEAGEGLGVFGEFVREEFKGHEAAELEVFGFVDHAHAAAAEFFGNAVVRDGLTDHGLGAEAGLCADCARTY